MRNRLLLLHFALMLVLVMASSALADSVPRMTTDELQVRLGEEDLVILDVRGSWDWNPADSKIARATEGIAYFRLPLILVVSMLYRP